MTTLLMYGAITGTTETGELIVGLISADGHLHGTHVSPDAETAKTGIEAHCGAVAAANPDRAVVFQWIGDDTTLLPPACTGCGRCAPTVNAHEGHDHQ